MSPQLHALIMVWSDATDKVRHRLETRANSSYRSWRAKGTTSRGMALGISRIDGLRDDLNDLVNHTDSRLIYEDGHVVGIYEQYLEGFVRWAKASGYPEPAP